MSLATYDDLKQSIISWSHRGDLDLLIDDFILLTEVEMFNNPIAVLEVRGQELTSAGLTTTGRIIALPTDYQSARSIRLSISSNGSEIRYRAPEQMIRIDSTGLPRQFTIVGPNIEFDRDPDAVYDVELKYFAKPVALSTSNQTNVVLTDNPNIYLYGSLKQLFVHATDEQEAAKYSAMFTAAIQGANKLSDAGRYGPAPQMRHEGSTP